MHYLMKIALFCVFLKLVVYESNAAASSSCNFFQGKWIFDSSYPLYNSLSCPYIEKEFGCLSNGRPDQSYLKYRWQPDGCELAKFDGEKLLEKYKGKNILFAGDSLTRDQYMSFACLLQSAVPNSNYTMIRQGLISTLTFRDYGVKIILDRNVFLVDLATEEVGLVLKIDKISSNSSNLWAGNHMLVFNTWHWWTYKGPQQPWKYIEFGGKLYKDMDRTLAYTIGLKTWAKWVDSTVDPTKTIVFFQGVSPSHYYGAEWHEPGTNCSGKTQPLAGTTYPGRLPDALGIQKNITSTMKTAMHFLDVTGLSQMRIDGHPSFYGARGRGMDCTHWCLAGVPDTWNSLLYNFLF